MPIDYAQYPDNWHSEIRPAILERANHRCEFCGVPNYELIIRSDTEPENYLTLDEEGEYYINGDGPIQDYWPEDYLDNNWVKVVLTIAHLDHDVTNNDPDNLRALCQRCHLIHDKDIHTERARKTRLRKRREAIRATGQLELFD